MPIGIQSVDNVIRGLLDGAYPTFGQTHFIVDSDFRTAAQGWSRADRTGPLDLAEARRGSPGGVQYVFRTGDYATDAACLQAAHDAAIAFRGDTLFFTPGSLSIGTIVNVTTETLRLLGPAVNYPLQARATLTATVDSALSLAATADDMELAFLKLIPLTNAVIADVTGAANRGYWHHFTYDADGVAGSTSTSLIDFGGAALDWRFDSFYILTDAAQAAPIVTTGDPIRMAINNFTHYHAGGTMAIGLLEVNGTASFGFDIGPGLGLVAGVTAAVTTLVDVADQATAISHGLTHDFRGQGYATATTLITLAGTTAEWTIASESCIFGTTDAAATTTTGTFTVGYKYTS